VEISAALSLEAAWRRASRSPLNYEAYNAPSYGRDSDGQSSARFNHFKYQVSRVTQKIASFFLVRV